MTMSVDWDGAKLEEIRHLADIRLTGFLIVYLITDESDNHTVKVEEEHDQMETELAERFLGGISIASFCF
jgi:hypothetical protein